MSTPILPVADRASAASSAHREIDRRLARSPRALAEELARVYGHEFATPTYIAAMAVISRLRLGERDEVSGLLAPVPRWHQGELLPGRHSPRSPPTCCSSSTHAGPGDDRAKALVLRAAASGFTDDGQLREFMPLHGGWSDSLFMDVPILATAGALSASGATSTWRLAHGVHAADRAAAGRSCIATRRPANAAWGRGNAFAALGLALTSSEFPQQHADYAGLLASYRAHMPPWRASGRERHVAQRHRSARAPIRSTPPPR
jgi:hypothetical protein